MWTLPINKVEAQVPAAPELTSARCAATPGCGGHLETDPDDDLVGLDAHALAADERDIVSGWDREAMPGGISNEYCRPSPSEGRP